MKNAKVQLSDVNIIYRAIAISTAMSKLLETVIANQVFSTAESEKYQFGFKANHPLASARIYLNRL